MKRTFVATVSGLLALVLLTQAAEAAGRFVAGGAAGRPQDNASKDCFQETFGSIQQAYCGGTPQWQLSMVVGPGGTYEPRYRVNATKGHVRCRSFGMSAYGKVFSQTPMTANTHDGLDFIGPGPVEVPDNGYLFGHCTMEHGTVLISVSWEW